MDGVCLLTTSFWFECVPEERTADGKKASNKQANAITHFWAYVGVHILLARAWSYTSSAAFQTRVQSALCSVHASLVLCVWCFWCSLIILSLQLEQVLVCGELLPVVLFGFSFYLIHLCQQNEKY